MSEKLVRPRQATLSAGLVMGGSFFVVLSVFERVSGLTSLETREAVEEFLDVPPGSGLGLSTVEALDLLRVLAMIAGAVAAAMGVLGFYVLQRSRGARLALSILAPVLFLTGMTAGGFLSAVVSAAVVMLWMQPSRAWFDGKQPPEPRPVTRREPATREGRPDQRQDQRPDQRQEQPSLWGPPPSQQPGRPSGQQSGQQSGDAGEPRAWQGFGSPAGGQPQPPAAYAPAHRQDPGRPAPERPTSLVWACALTWLGTGLATVGMGLVVLTVLVTPDLLFEELRRTPQFEDQDLSDATLRSAALGSGAFLLVWSLVAAALAGFAWRGARWARITLLVSASVAAALSLVSALSSIVALLPLGLCVATLVLLGRPDVRAWFAAR